MLLLIVVILAVFLLQGCNGPDGGGREAPYSTSPGPEGPAEGPRSQQVVVQQPVQERREGPVPGT